LLDRFADRLPGPGVAARRYARQHALEHSARERVLGGEVAVGGEPDLLAAVARPDPGALDLNAPPAEGHLTGGAAVAVGRALCVVAAPGPGDFGDLVLHRLVEDGQAGAGARPGDVGRRGSTLARTGLPLSLLALGGSLILAAGRIARNGWTAFRTERGANPLGDEAVDLGPGRGLGRPRDPQ
jgi:hypothetical protein